MSVDHSLAHGVEAKSEAANLKPVYLPEAPLALFGHNDLKIVEEARHHQTNSEAAEIFKDLSGNDVKIVSEQPIAGGKEYLFSDGTKEDAHKDGTLKITYQDGSSLTGKMNENGSWTEEHAGAPGAHDGFIITDYIKTTGKDGGEKVTYEGGTGGWEKVPGTPNQLTIFKFFGTRPEENYVSLWQNRSETVIRPDGHVSTVPR